MTVSSYDIRPSTGLAGQIRTGPASCQQSHCQGGGAGHGGTNLYQLCFLLAKFDICNKSEILTTFTLGLYNLLLNFEFPSLTGNFGCSQFDFLCLLVDFQGDQAASFVNFQFVNFAGDNLAEGVVEHGQEEEPGEEQEEPHTGLAHRTLLSSVNSDT